MGVSARTGKNIKSTKNSAVRDHMLVCNNNLIHRDGSHLNKTSESAPLMLFS